MDPETIAHRLDDLLNTWEELRAADRDLEANELCRECPELAPALQRKIDQLRAWDAFEGAASPAPTILYPGRPPSRPSGDGPASLPALDRYVMLERLGAGGMGEVYKARHTAMDKIVAIKVLPASALDSPEKVEQFGKEIRALGRLSHPNIVVTHDALNAQGHHFLVMEFIEGVDLGQLVLDKGPLPAGRAIDYVRQVAEALSHAHDAGIIHRDVKPSNLMVTAGGVIKVLDFGLARIRAGVSDGDAATTSGGAGPGSFQGTAQYASPEQADGGKARPQSDIYSLGCTLFYLLTGRPPYQDPSTLAILIAHRQAPIPSVRALRADAPPAVDELCRRMMAKAPEDRFRSMGELIAALDRVQVAQEEPQAGLGTTEVNRRGPDTKPGRAPGRPRRRIRVGLALLALPLLAILGGVIVKLVTAGGILVIEVDQPGAEVVVSGEGTVRITPEDSREPIEVKVETGAHRLTVRKGGFETHTERFTITSRERKTVQVHLEPIPPVVPPVDPPWVPGPPGASWAGIIPRPAKLPGVRRWQVETTAPRRDVSVVSWSPDPRVIAIADGLIVKLYDVKQKQVTRLLPGHTARVVALAWRAGGRMLATAGDDGTIRLWRDDGQRVKTIFGHNGPVRALAWTPDGSTLASGGGDNTVRFWNPDGSRQADDKAGRGGPIHALAWSRDGRSLATAEGDRTVCIRDRKGDEQKVLGPLQDQVVTLAWGPDRKTLAAGDTGGTLRLFDIEFGFDQIVAKQAAINAIGWCPDARSPHPIASGSDGGVHLWSLAGEPGVTLPETSIRSLSWNPDGRELVTVGPEERTVSIWSVAQRTNSRILDSSSMVRMMSWSPDGQWLASVGWGHGLRVWDGSGRQVAAATGLETDTGIVRWGPNSDRILSGSYSAHLRVWGFSDKTLAMETELFGTCSTCGWNAAGDLLAICNDRIIQIWNKDGTARAKLSGHEGEITALVWSPDGKRLASASRDRTVRIWSPDDPRARILTGHKADVEAVTWSPDGSRLASGGRDGTLMLWTADGAPGRSIERAHRGFISYLTWNPLYERVASIGEDLKLRIWDPDGGSARAAEGEYDGGVQPVWSRDGEYLAAVTGFGALQVDILDRDGRPRNALLGHVLEVDTIAWGPEEHQITTGGADQTIRVWDALTGEPAWVAACSGGGVSATFSGAGRFLHGEPAVVEDAFRYAVELDSGELLTLRPSEFRQRFPSPVNDPDRTAAEWALKLGSDGTGLTVKLVGSDKLLQVRRLEELPSEPFHIITLDRWGYEGVDVPGLHSLDGLLHLEHLGLYGTGLPNEGTKVIAGLASLRSIDLGATQTNDDGLERLAELESLQALNLGHTQVTDQGLGSLSGLKNLRELTLSGTKITDRGLPHLNPLQTLRRLALDRLPITDDGLATLTCLKTLELLNLDRTRITEAGVAVLADRATSLKELMIGTPTLGDEAVAHLPRLRSLSALSLNECRLSDQATATLAKMPALRVLTIAHTQIGDAGLRALSALNLEALNVEDTRTTKEGRDAFRSAHPNCQVEPADP